MYERFVEACVIRPQYGHLERAYDAYRNDSAPCKRGAANQCAVRMSIALARAGFGLEGFRPPGRVHSGNRGCATEGVSHVLGAKELADFLSLALGQPRIFPGSRSAGCPAAYTAIRGQHGILYFNDCFKRKGEAIAKGDHIDLFNGTQYYNQIIHPRAGGDETTGGDLFNRANAVWFWRL